MAVPNWVKLAALAPAPACAILLYMDQNITTRLVNASKGLKKPGAYHLDMFWLSLITAVTSICGLPWICASTVHSLTHVKSLTDVKQDPTTGREEVTGVTETRWTPLVLNLLIGASIIFLKDVLGQIPMCVLSGIFFYLGLAAMRGNEFLERVGMTLITDPAKMPASSPLTKSVSLPTLKKFTIMQIACLAVMWWMGSPRGDALPPSSSRLSAPSASWRARLAGSPRRSSTPSTSRWRPIPATSTRRLKCITIQVLATLGFWEGIEVDVYHQSVCGALA